MANNNQNLQQDLQMTSKVCLFDLEALRPLIEHSANSEAHRAPYDMGEPEPGLFLVHVHDQEVYLMSAGDPGLLRADGKTHQVVCAAGMGIGDADYWERSRPAVDGDDFVELIPLSVVSGIAESGAARFGIICTEDSLTFMATF